MASGIEWTDETWNVIAGCSPVSRECSNCYAAREAATRLRNHPKYAGTAELRGAGDRAHYVFNGTIREDLAALSRPLRWQAGRRIFVNSMSDLYHEGVRDWIIAAHYAVMAATPQHLYQILTKRPERQRAVLSDPAFPSVVGKVASQLYANPPGESKFWPRGRAREALGAVELRLAAGKIPWPLPNVVVGTSIGHQDGIERLGELIATPAALRFVSAEPLIGPVELGLLGTVPKSICERYTLVHELIHQVIAGGESLHGQGVAPQPMHPAWARALRDECQATGVAFQLKQWGQFRFEAKLTAAMHEDGIWPYHVAGLVVIDRAGKPFTDTGRWQYMLAGGRDAEIARIARREDLAVMRRVRDKHEAGRELDGRIWHEEPEAFADVLHVAAR